MTVKLLTEYNLEFISLIWDCTCLSESTLVKMPHCWKSHVAAHIVKHTLAAAVLTAMALSDIACFDAL